PAAPRGLLQPGAHGRLRLRQLRPRLQRQPRLPGRLQRRAGVGRVEPRPPRAARDDRVPRRPGRRVGARQPALHVGGGDARPHRLRHERRQRGGERRALPRRARVRRQRRVEAATGGRGADVPRLAHPHPAQRPARRGQRVRLRLGDEPLAPGGGARRLQPRGGGRRPEQPVLPHRGDPRPARRAAAGAGGERAARLRQRVHRRGRRALAGRQPRRRHPEHRRDRPVPRHHRLPRARARGRRLLGQRDPARHQRAGQPAPHRRGGGPELRLLALGHLQQRRRQGALHRRVGRGHAGALPGVRPPGVGGERDLHPGQPHARARRLLQAPGGADQHRELRGAQRLAHPGAGARHHGAGVVPGRHLGVRLHQPRAARGARLLRPRPDERHRARPRRLLVRVLVQRPHLRLRDRPRARRARAHARAAALAERDRRGEARARRAVQRAAADARRVAGELRRGARLPRPARARRRARRGARRRGAPRPR
ncbi:MAG: putative secreted protein, partial [uncultured Gemmatimonadaceae bacterium]